MRLAGGEEVGRDTGAAGSEVAAHRGGLLLRVACTLRASFCVVSLLFSAHSDSDYDGDGDGNDAYQQSGPLSAS